ncbi:MAG: phosphate signaling complex protein PhoU [Planctomycetes bacterium]|nr:phosphate signaling complex protein PhoU [Planctomycetota bacterium]
MAKKFDAGRSEVKKMLVEMGKKAESMIRNSMAALVERRPELIEEVMRVEDELDQMQKNVDDHTIRLIVTFNPVASNLRFLLMVARINTELERIGDQSVNICDDVRELIKEPLLKPLIDLPRMAVIATDMMDKALAAFEKEDDTGALEIIKRDREVDDLNNQIFRELLTYMISDPRTISRALALILIARSIERIADHATNIAEEVVFLVRGQDIRHTS